ncbi:MAG: hypothetical protein WBW99_10655 [Pseudolabrys sp.]
MTSRKPLVIAAALGSVAGLALAIQVRADAGLITLADKPAASAAIAPRRIQSDRVARMRASGSWTLWPISASIPT